MTKRDDHFIFLVFLIQTTTKQNYHYQMYSIYRFWNTFAHLCIENFKFKFFFFLKHFKENFTSKYLQQQQQQQNEKRENQTFEKKYIRFYFDPNWPVRTFEQWWKRKTFDFISTIKINTVVPRTTRFCRSA